MPNHIHLIVGLPNGGMLSREIGKFKSYTSHQIRQLVQGRKLGRVDNEAKMLADKYIENKLFLINSGRTPFI